MSTSTSSTSTSTPRQTGWVGWIAFGAMMLLLIGGLHIFQGLVALFNDEYYAVGKNGLVVHVDYTTWGWVHVIGGLVLLATGVGLLAGQMWARVLGVIAAMVSAFVNVAFLAAYPVWSTLMITIDVLVIWAITVHGREMKNEMAGDYSYRDDYYSR
jgi:hypothetical protein